MCNKQLHLHFRGTVLFDHSEARRAQDIFIRFRRETNAHFRRSDVAVSKMDALANEVERFCVPTAGPTFEKRGEALQKVCPIAQGIVVVHRGLPALAHALQKVAECLAVAKAEEHQVFLERMKRVSPEGNAHRFRPPCLFGGGQAVRLVGPRLRFDLMQEGVDGRLRILLQYLECLVRLRPSPMIRYLRYIALDLIEDALSEGALVEACLQHVLIRIVHVQSLTRCDIAMTIIAQVDRTAKRN